MADISQVKLPSGNTYDIKDDYFRNSFWDGINPTTVNYTGNTLPSTRSGINRNAYFTGGTSAINGKAHLVANLDLGSGLPPPNIGNRNRIKLANIPEND